MTDHPSKSPIEGQSAVPASSPPLPEVPFPAEYTGGPARGVDGQQEATGRRMTHAECVVALKRAEGLVDSAYSACTQAITAFKQDSPDLVAKAQTRLENFCLPEKHHEKRLIAQAHQVQAEIERWLPQTGEFAPLLATVSAAMNYALAMFMDVAIKQIQALPSRETLVVDTAGVADVVNRIRKTLNKMADGDPNALAELPKPEELSAAREKVSDIEKDLAKADDFLNTMAGCGILAGMQVAAALQAIAGYIETRNEYLRTYLVATDYSKESDDAKGHVARAGFIQGVYGAIATAVGQYVPRILPTVFTQLPLIGLGFAILDVARTMNEKRDLVEERKSHLEALAEAHRKRGQVDENYWLEDRLDDDEAALYELVNATVEMCVGLLTLAGSAQADPVTEVGS